MKYQLSGLAIIALALSGCGGSDSPKNHSSSAMAMSSKMVSGSSVAAMSSAMMTSSSAAAMTKVKYSVTLTNLTAGQPFSPLVYSLHYPGFSPFIIGMPATLGLEKIAESGASDDFIMMAKQNTDVLLADQVMGLTLPGESKTFPLSLEVEMTKIDQVRFSLVNMLGNTNDAFAGLNSIAIGELEVGESLMLNAMSYDAGTELNSESKATVPGPAGGGEGFNAARDDTADQVTMHPGVATQEDGKMDSTLTHMHRWDNPVARITITRLTP